MEWSTSLPADIDEHLWGNESSSSPDERNLLSSSMATPLVPSSGISSVWGSGHAQIPLYALILLLAVTGNALVIVTLVQNTRMRTVTNVFLLNLAVSDLLLGVFCMPFTLVGMLLRQFVFGETMCKAIPYFQAVSVAVSSWTLVAISVERYFAICQPLRSRRWQTLSHAYKMIGVVWIAALACMTPIAVLSTLQPIRMTGKMKCREAWPEEWLEQAFNLILDLILLVVPLVIMIITYSLIRVSLHQGMKMDEATESRENFNLSGELDKIASKLPNGITRTDDEKTMETTYVQARNGSSPKLLQSTCYRSVRNPQLRQSNVAKSFSNKRRVIKMLFVVVLEFFICWTPLYIVNTISLFAPAAVYGGLGVAGISLCQLLAYASSCCNPITYCFMNMTFRRAFITAFGCSCQTQNGPKRKWAKASSIRSSANDVSVSTSSFYQRC